MADEVSGKEMDKALFMSLVMMFSSTAMQQLGKLLNPVTQKVEVDMRGAQASIDVLTMLAAKTKGNLDKDEERMLGETISALQMNYVETAQSASSPETRKEAPGAGSDGRAETGSAHAGAEKKDQAGPSAGDSSGKTPKFHKSYGEA